MASLLLATTSSALVWSCAVNFSIAPLSNHFVAFNKARSPSSSLAPVWTSVVKLSCKSGPHGECFRLSANGARRGNFKWSIARCACDGLTVESSDVASKITATTRKSATQPASLGDRELDSMALIIASTSLAKNAHRASNA